jgi:Ca2+/Na+ antiporter
MELDELKDQLRQKLDESFSKSESDISGMLKKKTVSIVYKLQKSLRLEIIFCIGAIIAFALIGIFSKHWSLQVYFSTFTIVFLLFMIVLFYLQKRIKQLGSTQLSVKSNLQLIHSIIKEYVKRVFQFTMALIPICMVFAFWLGIKDGDDFSFDNSIMAKLSASNKTLYAFLLLYMLIVIVAAYYSTKWYLKKLYVKYLVQLQECIDELGE